MPDWIMQINWPDGDIYFYEFYDIGKSKEETLKPSQGNTVAIWTIKPRPHA